ncbi:MAG: hypothetical protein FWE91_04575, partial [Defluviitaleaceae bacterium]|nr:hypothetical protein [Defluviitaleaceae bacterium]
MSGLDIASIVIIILALLLLGGLLKFISSLISRKSDVFNFERDHEEALYKPTYKRKKPEKESTMIGLGVSKKDVYVPNDAKHVFICGTTGSG